MTTLEESSRGMKGGNMEYINLSSKETDLELIEWVLSRTYLLQTFNYTVATKTLRKIIRISLKRREIEKVLIILRTTSLVEDNSLRKWIERI